MKKFGSESGTVLIFVALSMTLLLGFVGFATDVGVLLHERREAQTAADSAALAAASEAMAEGSPTTVTSSIKQAAQNDAALNGFTDGANGTTVTVSMAPNLTVPTFNTSGYIQATVTRSTPDFFMKIFGYKSTNVGAMAIATQLAPTNYCVNVQNPGNSANPAVYLSGASSLTAQGCAISVNGNLTLKDGGTSIDASFITVSGAASGNISVPYSTGVPPQGNPLPLLNQTAYQPAKNPGSPATCTSPDGSTCYYDYKGGNLTGPIQLNAGVYYYDVPVNISGAVSGTGVMFYLAGTIPFDFDANGNLNLTPISTGIFDQVLIDAPNDGPYTTCKPGKGNNSGNAGELYFDFGSSNTTLKGIIYAPQAELFAQDKGASLSIATNLVIGNICDQSGTITVKGLNPSPITRATLVY